MLKKISVLTICFIMMLAIYAVAGKKTASAADNNLYSDEVYNKYYYEQLSDSSKYIYDSIYSNIDHTMTGVYEIKMDLSSYNVPAYDSTSCFQSAIDAFDRDHPEVFWLDYNKIEFRYSIFTMDDISYIRNVFIGTGNYDTYLIDSYNNKDDVMADFNDVSDYVEEVLPVINAFNGTNETYDKLKYIHDLLVRANEYNPNLDTASLKAHKCVSAIPGNTTGEDAPVCEGYSRAFKVLCDNASIPCVIVTGEGIVSDENVPHMWNYVMVNDRWYAVDVTWDDPILINDTYDNLSDTRKYKYFLKGSSDFFNNHYENNVFVTKENYDYQFGYPLIEYDDYEITLLYYSITMDNIKGGTITTNLADNNFVTPGTVVKLTINADEDMTFVQGSLKINDKYYYATSFIMPESNVMISGNFAAKNTKAEDETKNNEDKQSKSTKKPAVEKNTKSPATQKPDNDNNDSNNETLNKPDNQSLDNETMSPEVIKQSTQIITIDDANEFDDQLNNAVNDFTDEGSVKLTINNHTSMERGQIKVGFRHTSIYEDVIVSFYNTIFDSKELEQMLFSSIYKTNYFSHLDSFSMRVSKASNGVPIALKDDEYLSVLLPLSDIYYDKKQGISLLFMKDSILTEHEFSIINYGKRNYIYFKSENASISFMIVYKSEKENISISGDSFVSPITDEVTSEQEITPPAETDDNKLIILASVCITIMVFIMLFIIIFEIYMFYLNKI